ncbi:MAG: transglutaminase domain-containing protein [Pseudomonadota bacterium]
MAEPSAMEAARRIHDEIRDGVLFGWGPHFWDETPAETLTRGRGYALTKGAALVHRFREAGFDARLVCAEIDASILEGFMEPPMPRIDHGMAEVKIADRWLCVDGFALDRPLFRAAQARLAAEGRQIGYGTHVTGSIDFPGFSQFVAAPQVRGYIWGRFDGVHDFYNQVPEAHNRTNWMARQFFSFYTTEANQRIDTLRASA